MKGTQMDLHMTCLHGTAGEGLIYALSCGTNWCICCSFHLGPKGGLEIMTLEPWPCHNVQLLALAEEARLSVFNALTVVVAGGRSGCLRFLLGRSPGDE